MQEEDILLGISQLSIVFAGFISIFMAFIQKEERISEVDAIRARVVIYSSFGTSLAALTPLVLAGLGASEEIVWPISAGVYLALGTAISVDIFLRQRRAAGPRTVARATVGLVSWSMTALMSAISIAVILGFGGGGLFVLVLVLNLALATLSFIAFVLERVL